MTIALTGDKTTAGLQEIFDGEPYTSTEKTKLSDIGTVEEDSTSLSLANYTSSTPAATSTVTLDEGTWIISGNMYADGNVAYDGSLIRASIGTSSGVINKQYATQHDVGQQQDNGSAVPTRVVTITSSTTYYLNVEIGTIPGTGTLYTNLYAVKVA